MSFAITKDGNLTVFFDNERQQVGRTISEGDVVAHMTIPVTDGELQQLRDLLNELYPLEQPEPGQADYSDIRPGDIVEFDRNGTHFGPTVCFEDEDGDWYIKGENWNERRWFVCDYGTPFYDDIENIVIHRELRQKEPRGRDYYLTQTGKILRHFPESSSWIQVDTNNVSNGIKWAGDRLYASWNFVCYLLPESEFPLRKAKLVAE